MKLFNTLGRELQEFNPITGGKVGIYSCGPTVYWNQHIGHMYAYVQWDSMVRLFRYLGYETKWVMNITDVGHLTSDEDTGEDKMEKGAEREQVSVWQIADKYIKQFLDSLDLLNIQRPDILCRATEHINEQIELIKKIEVNGFTYKTATGIVFDTAKFPGYADFAKLDLKKQEAGARVEIDPEKKNPWDFLLWVTNQPNHIMQWESPWGRGFPGWHIECTAMSTKYLGERFDIHTGGKEHVAVHHTNEIAQGFGAFGQQTANYWLHNEWLMLKGQKISKSLGNMILVTDLIEKGYEPLALRYLFLTSHYRTGMDFTYEALDGASSALNKLRRLLGEWGKKGKEGEKGEEGYIEKFRDVVSDDLNFAKGIALVWEVTKSDLSDSDKLATILEFDKVLGLKLGETSRVEQEIPAEVKQLVEEREKFRSEKKWEEADRVRSEIEAVGFRVEDTDGGQRIERI